VKLILALLVTITTLQASNDERTLTTVIGSLYNLNATKRQTVYSQILEIINSKKIDVNKSKPGYYTPFEFIIRNLSRAVEHNPTECTDDDQLFIALLVTVYQAQAQEFYDKINENLIKKPNDDKSAQRSMLKILTPYAKTT
jgi:transcriptional regulator with AAA-type ATPase domain